MNCKIPYLFVNSLIDVNYCRTEYVIFKSTIASLTLMAIGVGLMGIFLFLSSNHLLAMNESNQDDQLKKEPLNEKAIEEAISNENNQPNPSTKQEEEQKEDEQEVNSNEQNNDNSQ